MKLKVQREGFEVEVEGPTVQDVWKQAAFWSSLPTTCPVDGTPVVFGFAKRGGYDYWYLESTGQKKYRFNYGLSTEEKGALFPGSYDRQEERTVKQWTYWDGEKEVVAWDEQEANRSNGSVQQQPPPRASTSSAPVQTNGHSTEPVTRTTAVNITDKQCPECYAPPGKLHGNNCTKKTIPVGA